MQLRTELLKLTLRKKIRAITSHTKQSKHLLLFAARIATARYCYLFLFATTPTTVALLLDFIDVL